MRRFGSIPLSQILHRSLNLAVVCFVSIASICWASPTTSGGAADTSGFNPNNATYVYVGSYDFQTSSSSLYGFAIASDGSAAPIPGSPFAGAASNYLVATPSNLFAAQGANIATYTVAPDGALQQTSLIDGVVANPNGAGMGIGSLSVDRNYQTLYAGVVCGSCNNYYSQWAIGPGGQLSYISDQSPFSTLSAIWGWQPLTFSLDDHYAYTPTVCKFGGEVAGFLRQQDGALTDFAPGAQPPSSGAAGGGVGCSENLAASTAGYLAIAWTGSYCCQYPGTVVATYRFNSDGSLALVQGPAIIPSVTSEYSMAFDPTGRYLAIAGANGPQNGTQGAIQVYQLASNGKLTALGPVVQVPSVTAFTSVSWDTHNHLYALAEASQSCSGENCALYIFDSNAGVLTAAPGSPHPVPQPVSLAVLPKP